tara:strand:- start:1170 stop:1679 length:510 start_codon:yes stop_codon:yes gene_type:complete
MNLKEEFYNRVEEKTWEILNKKGSNPGRQSIATTRGQQVEVVAEEILNYHPNVDFIETQVYNENVDEFSNIDLVINTLDGRRVYVPCSRDMWLGTSQQDRLQILWTKFKSEMLNNVDIFYLQLDDVNDILNKKFRKNTRRGVKIQSCVSTLHSEGLLGNIDTLWNKLDV